MIFLGSILYRNFPWRREMLQCIGELRNYVATDDLVVAIFPSFFETTRLVNPFNRKFGSAGHTGFTNVPSGFENIYWIEGGHGAGLNEEHRDALVSYLVGDDPAIRPSTSNRGLRPRTVWAHKASIVIVPVLVLIAAAIFWASMRFNPWSPFGVPVLPAGVAALYLWMFFRF